MWIKGMKIEFETKSLSPQKERKELTPQTHLSRGSLSPEVPAVLAEGWKEANIRMGLLRCGTGKSGPED